MLVKVLQYKDGTYLKDYCLESYSEIPIVENCIGLMGYWLTNDPKEAMHFYTSISAIVTRNWVGRDFDYKNVEI